MQSAIQWFICVSSCNWSNAPWPPPRPVDGAGECPPAQGEVSAGSPFDSHLEPLPAASIQGLEIDLILDRYARYAWQVSEIGLFSQKRPSDKVLAPSRFGGGHALTPAT